jgi:hypothetical protein
LRGVLAHFGTAVSALELGEAVLILLLAMPVLWGGRREIA